MNFLVKKIGTLAVAAVLVVLMASPLSARGSEVTNGSFESFAAGAGHEDYGDVEGTAMMIRTASDKTIVVVTARGLTPGETYGSHVHKQACDSGDAGGHYSFGFAVPGGALDGSEIWPGPFTANAAGHAAGWTVVGDTAGPDAVSVVIHAPGGAKIACADLG
jgi:Cu/Zn superoxide dismutase